MRLIEPRDQELLNFCDEYYGQINRKSRRFKLEIDEIKSELAVTYQLKIHLFDPEKGTLAAFLFGHLEKQLKRRLTDALSYSISIDDPSEQGLAFRAHVEAIAHRNLQDNENENLFSSTNADNKHEFAEAISIARAISGKSSAEIAEKLGVSRRRVNQILARIRSQKQISQKQLFLFNDEKEVI